MIKTSRLRVRSTTHCLVFDGNHQDGAWRIPADRSCATVPSPQRRPDTEGRIAEYPAAVLLTHEGKGILARLYPRFEVAEPGMRRIIRAPHDPLRPKHI